MCRCEVEPNQKDQFGDIMAEHNGYYIYYARYLDGS